MELMPYQERVVRELGEFLKTLERAAKINVAFRDYWAERGCTGMDAYKNNVKGVPHVCAKVPTAGGKTYIAVNALKTIFDAIHRHNPKRPAFVVWLVPSLTILEQTVKALGNPEHPYRMRLNQQFRNRVAVYEKKDLLLGAGFSFDTVQEQLSIVVMSFDSLRARNKEDRKVYQENGYLASFLATDTEDNDDWRLPDCDPSALINVIRRLKPVVIVDESHNAESELSVKMLSDLNPHFIYDLTATPRNNSNIISYVDALQLKKHNMVKLPVIVANRRDKNEVIEAALNFRRKLEEQAAQEAGRSGKKIRPVVLFQAQPKTSDDNITFEKIRETLIDLKIPAEQIKIKTAAINELKNIDLMAEDCPVRYIITVNALKEGWDCPNAYILAALGDKSSAVDVEQILGRVLRMPYVRKHSHDLLNMSYVFTASNRFNETLQNVVKALNHNGFSDRDYRVLAQENNARSEPTPNPMGMGEIFNPNPEPNLVGDNLSQDSILNTNIDDIQVANIAFGGNVTEVTPDTTSNQSDDNPFVAAISNQASAEDQAFETIAAQVNEMDVTPPELDDKMNKHKIKAQFKDDVLALKLPQFFMKVAPGGWLEEEDQLVARDLLLTDFKLAQLDATVSFEDVASGMYRIDLEQVGNDEYVPKPFKMDKKRLAILNDYIRSQPKEVQIFNLTERLFQQIGNLQPIDDTDIKRYIRRIVDALTTDQLDDCIERSEGYTSNIRKKIESLRDEHAFREFLKLVEIDKVFLKPNYSLPEHIKPKANGPAIPNSLYVTEADMGAFEYRIIEKIANLGNIEWWHRNFSKGKGFCINGFKNHYPDFIVKTKSGNIILVETKGKHLDNSDSKRKVEQGRIWQGKIQKGFKYMMVFEDDAIKGAVSLGDAIDRIKQL